MIYVGFPYLVLGWRTDIFKLPGLYCCCGWGGFLLSKQRKLSLVVRCAWQDQPQGTSSWRWGCRWLPPPLSASRAPATVALIPWTLLPYSNQSGTQSSWHTRHQNLYKAARLPAPTPSMRMTSVPVLWEWPPGLSALPPPLA